MGKKSRKGRNSLQKNFIKSIPDPAYIYAPENPNHEPFDMEEFKIKMYDMLVPHVVQPYDYLHLMSYLAPISKFPQLREEEKKLIWEEVPDFHTASTCRNYGKSTNLLLIWLPWLIHCPVANFALIVKYKQNFNEALTNSFEQSLSILKNKKIFDEETYEYLKNNCKKRDKFEFGGRKIDFLALNTPGSSLGIQPSSDVKPLLTQEYKDLAKDFVEKRLKEKEKQEEEYRKKIKENFELLGISDNPLKSILPESSEEKKDNLYYEEEELSVEIDLGELIRKNNEDYLKRISGEQSSEILQPFYLAIAIEELIKSSDHEKTGSEKELSFEQQMISLKTIRSSLDRANGFNPFTKKVTQIALMNPWDPNNEYYQDNVEFLIPLVPHVGDKQERLLEIEKNQNKLRNGSGAIYRINKDKDGIVRSAIVASHLAIPEERKDSKWWANFKNSSVEAEKDESTQWQHSAIYFGIPIPTIKDDAYSFKFTTKNWVNNGVDLKNHNYEVEDYFLGYDPGFSSNSESGSYTAISSFLVVSYFEKENKYYKILLWKIDAFNAGESEFTKRMHRLRKNISDDMLDLRNMFSKNLWKMGKEWKDRADSEILVFCDPRSEIATMPFWWEVENKRIMEDKNLSYSDLVSRANVLFLPASFCATRKMNLSSRDRVTAELIITGEFGFVVCCEKSDKCDLKENCYYQKQLFFFNPNTRVPSVLNHIEKNEKGERKQAAEMSSKIRHLTDVLDSIHYGLIEYLAPIEIWVKKFQDYSLTSLRIVELKNERRF